MEIITKIKDKQQQESRQNLLRAAEQEAKIQALTIENIKIAAEIQTLNITVEELSNDNHHVKRILDIKQNEWTKIEEKKKAVAHSGQRTSQNTTLGVESPAQRELRPRDSLGDSQESNQPSTKIPS